MNCKIHLTPIINGSCRYCEQPQDFTEDRFTITPAGVKALDALALERVSPKVSEIVGGKSDD